MKEIDLLALRKSLEGLEPKFYLPYFERWTSRQGTYQFWDNLTMELFRHVQVLREIAILERRELGEGLYVLPEELARLEQVMACLNTAFSVSHVAREIVAKRDGWQWDKEENGEKNPSGNP